MPDQQAELLAVFARLDAASRRSLLDFARFLLANNASPAAQAAPYRGPDVVPPGPPDETVIAALKRMRGAYAGLDTDTLLTRASALMSEHLLQGREAAEVIRDIEQLFADESRRRSAGTCD
ncbi:hypothetical protein Q4485_11005 [Granulosicoccaceae sp. 1_MG-2023]|nr:hypothetical protein [Granulosicoccaceae sp. 1_MG-2023]